MRTTILTSLRTSLVLMLVCGLLYNLVLTGAAQALMPGRADGSLIYNGRGEAIGSELIGQSFTDPGLFHGRVSSIGYDAGGSGTPNYAPSNPDLIARVRQAARDWRTNNPDVPLGEVPLDLLMNSGSGLDPHISPEAAAAQIPRIAGAAGLDPERLQALVDEHTSPRALGIFGERTVNVLRLNLALRQLTASQ